MRTVTAIGLTCTLVVLYLWDPAATTLYPSCPFHALTGYYCPGCGSLRAIHQLLHGEIENAFRLNPLLVLCLPPLAYAALASQLQWFRFAWAERMRRSSSWPWVIVAMVSLFWLLRNLPYPAFSWLAPHAPSTIEAEHQHDRAN
jgi:hypothetical protein